MNKRYPPIQDHSTKLTSVDTVLYAVYVHVNGVGLFNSLNREIHAHKQVYMSSGHKREQGKPPFLQCIYAYVGVSEAKELRDVQNVNTLLLSLPSRIAGYGYGFLYGSKVNQASPRVSTFADTDTWWHSCSLFRRRNDYEAAGTSGVLVRDSIGQRR